MLLKNSGPLPVCCVIVIAAICTIATLFNPSTSLAVQEGVLPPLRPANRPDESNPFANYESEPQQDQSDPFANYESEPQQDDSNPFGNYESDQSATPPASSATTEFVQNDLRSDTPPAAPQQAGQTPARRLPPIAQPKAPQQAENYVMPSNVQTPPTTNGVITDSNLQPASYNEPVVHSAPIANTAPRIAGNQPSTAAATPAPRQLSQGTQMAKSLLSELTNAQASMNGTGQPMQLLDIVTLNPNSSQRKALVNQYWQTYSAWAKYRFAVDERQWLQQMSQSRNESDRAAIEAAQSVANDTVDSAALELNRQQHLLNGFIGGPKSETLPMPSDTPLVTRYRTNFEIYDAQQHMHQNLRAIDDWLPKQQVLIGNQAMTVQRSRNAAMQNIRAIAQGQPIATALHTLAICRQSQESFISSVVKYNQSIADYALSVRPYHSAEKSVAMLIPMKSNAAESQPTINNRGLRQANLADTPYQQSTTPPSTGMPAAPRNNPSFNRGINQPAAGRGLPGQNRMDGARQGRPQNLGSGRRPPVMDSGMSLPNPGTNSSSAPLVPRANSGTGNASPPTGGLPPFPPSNPTGGNGGGGFRR